MCLVMKTPPLRGGIQQQLHGIVGIVVDRYTAGLQQEVQAPGGFSDASQCIGGEDSESTTNTTIRRALMRWFGKPASSNASMISSPSSTSRMATLSATRDPRGGHRADEAVAKRFLGILHRPDRARRGTWRIRRIGESPHPSGKSKTAGAAVIVESHRRKHHRHRRRRRGGAGQSHCVEIRADQIEPRFDRTGN